MLRNNILSAFRNFLKHVRFSLINVGGLVLGLTTGIYVIHYAQLEYGYDEFHADAGRIYRVSTLRIKDGLESSRFATTFSGVAPAIKDEYSEVGVATRLYDRWRGGVISYESIRFREQGIFNIDSGFFEVFDFPVLSGSADDLLQPGIAFVEEKTAKKYFGESNPIGKRIRFGSVNGNEDYEIRGVVRCPENSSIKFTFLLSYKDLARIFGTEHLSNWAWVDFHTFIKLRSGGDPNRVEASLPHLLEKYQGERAANFKLSLQHLPEIYFHSKAEFETGITGNETTIRIMLILGVLVIIIAWINFINLSTSQALNRAKEVGIRKTLGSSRNSLILQFMIETFLINLIAIILSMLLLWTILPLLNQLTTKAILFEDIIQQQWWILVFVFLMGGTIVIGIYPAVQLSSLQPMQVIKGFFVPKEKGAMLREGFVGLQALVSFTLIASILIIIDQLKYISNQDAGIALEKTLVVRTPEVVLDYASYFASIRSFKNEMGRNPGVLGVSTSVDSPGQDVGWISGTRKIGAESAHSTSFYRAIIDEDYLETMKIEVVAGEGFRQSHSTHDVLLNETATKALGFEIATESIGQEILIGRDTFEVIGVVKDYHHVTPRKSISPTVFHYNLETPHLFFIRFEGENTNEMIQSAKGAFEQLYPDDLFDYYFLDEFYDRQNASDRKLATVIGVFCSLAIIVSGLGLLGLTWFRISRQKKELAIRKVIGSTDANLFFTASKRIFMTTVVGSLVGAPLSWYLMQQWLERFSVHTTPKLWHFTFAMLFSLVITLSVISGYTLRVIRSNPVDQLRQD